MEQNISEALSQWRADKAALDQRYEYLAAHSLCHAALVSGRAESVREIYACLVPMSSAQLKRCKKDAAMEAGRLEQQLQQIAGDWIAQLTGRLTEQPCSAMLTERAGLIFRKELQDTLNYLHQYSSKRLVRQFKCFLEEGVGAFMAGHTVSAGRWHYEASTAAAGILKR